MSPVCHCPELPEQWDCKKSPIVLVAPDNVAGLPLSGATRTMGLFLQSRGVSRVESVHAGSELVALVHDGHRAGESPCELFSEH